MKITFNDADVTPELDEAPQDNSDPVFLSESENGLCSAGHAVCYAIIIQNTTDCGLFHISNSEGVVQKIQHVISKLETDSPNDDIRITLASSAWGYNYQRTEDMAHGDNTLDLEAVDFFNARAAELTEIIEEHFEITPETLDLPCPCLVITKNNEINLLEIYSQDPGAIGYKDNEDLELDEDMDYEEEEKSGLSPR